MIESIQGILEKITLFDYIYLVLTILFIISVRFGINVGG